MVKKKGNDWGEMEFPKVAEMELGCGMGGTGVYLPLDTHKALINPESASISGGDADKDKPFLYSIVTKDYVLIRHEDLIAKVEGVMAEFPEYGEREVEVGFGPGGRMRLEYSFPEIQYDIGRGGVGDLVHPTWTFFNSYDGGWALRGLFGAFRLVCSNGLVIGEKFAHYRQEHHQLEEDVELLKQTMRNGMERFSVQTEIWKGWVDRVMERAEAEHVARKINWSPGQWNRLLEEPESQTGIQLQNLFGRPERKENGVVVPEIVPTLTSITKWELFNVITQFITHGIESMVKRRRLEDMARRTFGR